MQGPAQRGRLRRNDEGQPGPIGLTHVDGQLLSAGQQVGDRHRPVVVVAPLLPPPILAPISEHSHVQGPRAQGRQMGAHPRLHLRVGPPAGLVRRPLGRQLHPEGRAVDRRQQRAAGGRIGPLHQLDDGGDPLGRRMGEDLGGRPGPVADIDRHAEGLDHEEADHQHQRHPAGQPSRPQAAEAGAFLVAPHVAPGPRLSAGRPMALAPGLEPLPRAGHDRATLQAST